MPFEQFAERIEFATADREHEFMVGQRFGSGWHGSRMVFNQSRLGKRTNFWKVGDHGVGKTCWLLQQTHLAAKGYKQRSVDPKVHGTQGGTRCKVRPTEHGGLHLESVMSASSERAGRFPPAGESVRFRCVWASIAKHRAW